MIRPEGSTIRRLDQFLSPILAAGVLDPSLVGGTPHRAPKEPVFGPWGVEYPDGTFDANGTFLPADRGEVPTITLALDSGPTNVPFDEYLIHHTDKTPLWHVTPVGLAASTELGEAQPETDAMFDSVKSKPIQVADAKSAPSGSWSDPTAWAIGEAGEAIAETLDPIVEGIEDVGEAVWDMIPDAPERPKIDWEDEPVITHQYGNFSFETDGAILVGIDSVTFGMDGADYRIKWTPLNENGNPVQNISPDDAEFDAEYSERIFSNATFSIGAKSKGSTQEIMPPPELKSGHWRAELVRVPNLYNGNSAGVRLSMTSEKGKTIGQIQ